MKTIVFSSILLVSQWASASFIESCLIKGTVVSTESLVLAGQGLIHPQRQTVLSVKEVSTNPRSHVSCDRHLGSMVDMSLQSISLEEIAGLEAGDIIEVSYTYSNFHGRNGVEEQTRTTIHSQAATVYDKALQIAEVRDVVDRTQRSMTKSYKNKIGVLAIPSACGFVGCETNYLITLVYRDGRGQGTEPSRTIVLMVYADALGDIKNVKILQDPAPKLYKLESPVKQFL